MSRLFTVPVFNVEGNLTIDGNIGTSKSGGYVSIRTGFNIETLRCDDNQNVIFGSQTPGSDNSSHITSSGIIHIYRSSGVSQENINFSNGGNLVGSIRTSTTTTNYNITSDYRVKDNVEQISNATDIVMQLKPSKYSFKATPDIINTGFIAHELQDHVAQAVTGVKDGKEMQSVDYSKLVAILTASLQDAHEKISELEKKFK